MAKRVQRWWIKERSNPQFDKVYFVGCWQLSEREAKSYETPVYGANKMIPFESEAKYIAELDRLKKSGASVQP